MNYLESINNISKSTGLDIKKDILLAPFTTWKIGGKAEALTKVKTKNELIDIIQYCIKESIPFTILGKGSNVLISDKGIKGLVIINEYSSITLLEESLSINAIENNIKPRINVDDFSQFDYPENDCRKKEVIIASGTILSHAINQLIQKGITGLQWFSGIPGTIGGAIFNNIHGGSHFISEYILNALVIDSRGNLLELSKDEMNFDYDKSIFHNSKLIIIEARFLLNQGDQKKALETSQAWVKKKLNTQAYNSGGCCFKNLDTKEMDLKKFESASWGYIIDKLLHLKGKRVGDAIISNKHGAFIENIGNAKSSDVLELFNLIHSTAKEKLGITPKTEIIFLGFEKQDIQKFL